MSLNKKQKLAPRFEFGAEIKILSSVMDRHVAQLNSFFYILLNLFQKIKTTTSDTNNLSYNPKQVFFSAFRCFLYFFLIIERVI